MKKTVFVFGSMALLYLATVPSAHAGWGFLKKVAKVVSVGAKIAGGLAGGGGIGGGRIANGANSGQSMNINRVDRLHQDYSRTNSHNISGNVKNSVLGDYKPMVGIGHGASFAGGAGFVPGGRFKVDVGGIHGNKNQLDMSMGGNYFGLGDNMSKTYNVGNTSIQTNLNSQNSFSKEDTKQ